MSDRINHLVNEKIKVLETNFLEFDYVALDKTPDNEEELLFAYVSNTYELYEYLRYFQYFLHPSSNEIRAILGHLSQYRMSNYDVDKNDLRKAYGHFRRLNLDLLKILCDIFNKNLYRILTQQYKYDLRNVKDKYLVDFGNKYIKARQLYLKAQKEESSGSDRDKHNIIELYFEAAKEFVLLKQYYFEYKNQIEKAKNRKRIKIAINLIMLLAGVFFTVAGAL